ncbi:MAG: uracil-DNA glycosylase [Snodgrassella sp.]|nr:uracil-DNA glycosylase [Snodgrassella sp.]
MLDSRYLYLHEALGLGPMWLSQSARLHVTAIDASTNTDQNNEIANHKLPSEITAAAVYPTLITANNLQENINTNLSDRNNRLNALHSILKKNKKTDNTTLKSVSTPESMAANNSTNSSITTPELVLQFDEIPTSIATCTRCSLHQERCAPIVGHGDKSARLLVITPNPAPADDSSQQLFSGETGKLLNNMLAAINIGANEVFYTSQVKCAPNISLRITPEQIQACMPALQAQIKHIQPKAILLLGQVFNQLEEQNCLGNYLLNIPYVIAPHPARLLHQSHLKASAWSALKTLHNYLQ